MTAQIQTIQLTLKTTTAILKVVRETPKVVHSVNILTSFGEVVVFRDGTIKLWEDCPELH